jgi:putative endonuclease
LAELVIPSESAKSRDLAGELALKKLSCARAACIRTWTRVVYIGVTDDLTRPIVEHREGKIPGFTSQYRVKRLVYFEECIDAETAIAREKQLKSWRRDKRLIEVKNPNWIDPAEKML